MSFLVTEERSSKWIQSWGGTTR